MFTKEKLGKNNLLGHITLNNPEKHNAFDDILIESFIQALEEIEQDKTIRAVLLSAVGTSFSAGADLNWMKKMASYSEKENFDDAMQLAHLMQKLYTLNKPTIALVQGNAFGGALGLIACCDIALSTREASFCFSEVKLGLIPAVISPYIIAAIGERTARRYFITAERFSAEEALNMKLIHCISNNLMSDGMTLIKKISQNSPKAITDIKNLVREISPHSLIDEIVIQKTVKAIAKIRVSSEGQEGLNAFLEKRSPYWLDLS